MRGSVMADADVIITLGRRLDFQRACGSPAVIGNARFIRIAVAPPDCVTAAEARSRCWPNPRPRLAAVVAAAGDRAPAVDRDWAAAARSQHLRRVRKLQQSMQTAPPDGQGHMHPNRLQAMLQTHLHSDASPVTDGGDFLSFAGGPAGQHLFRRRFAGPHRRGHGLWRGHEPGVPGAPGGGGHGDGAFGFNAMEIDTAVCHGAKSTAQQHLPALLDVLVSTEARSSDGQSGLAWVPDLQAVQARDTAEHDRRQTVP